MKTRSGRKPSQQPSELYRFLEVLKESGAASYLEVGARHGDTFFEVVKSLPKGSRAVAVDLPGGSWGISSSAGHLKSCAAELRSMGYVVDVIMGDSTSKAVIDQVESLGPFDAVFIDGDHRYEGVKKDWLNYGNAPIVGFHDIDGRGIMKGDMAVEVPKLWDEIKDDYRHESIIDNADGRKMGIGVIWR